MGKEKIPTQSPDGLVLSKWGRISTYTEEAVGSIKRDLIFARLTDEKELINRLTTIVDNIKEISDGKCR